jgi:hypothetical protein
VIPSGNKPTDVQETMADIHQFRRPRPPRRSSLDRNKLVWLLLLAGACAATASRFLPPLGLYDTLIGCAVMFGGYAALYDRTRG